MTTELAAIRAELALRAGPRLSRPRRLGRGPRVWYGPRLVSESGASRVWWMLGPVLAWVAAASAGRFGNGFVHDDRPMLAGGLIHDPSRLGEVFTSHALVAHGASAVLPMDTYRPLSIASFFGDAWLSGTAPWSYHLTNLLLHLACVATVFAWARAAVPRASPWVLAASALFFGLSPQLVEAHIWINGRSDPLATLCGVGALLVWRRALVREGVERTWLLGLTALLFLAGLLSKEVLLFSLPMLVLWPSSTPQSWRARLTSVLPFVAAACVYLGMRSAALGGMRASRDVEQLRGALHNLPILWLDGLRELLSPERLYLRSLREEYAALSELQVLALLALVLVIAGLAWLVRRRLPWLSWSLGWYALSLAPAALISAILWPGFGRYLYLPCAGLAVGVAELLAALEQRLAEQPTLSRRMWGQGLMLSILVVYLTFFGVRLAAYARDYADERALYGAARRAAPAIASGHARMAGLLVQEGKVSDALGAYRQAIALDPREPSFALSAIFWSLRTGESRAAEQLARQAMAKVPAPQVGAFRALLIRALAERDARAAVAELCACLTEDPALEACLQAPRWMLDPRGARYPDLHGALLRFADTCPSEQAQRALAQSLRAR